MIEIPIWILYGKILTTIGVGLGIGYKIAEKQPSILANDAFCEIVHFLQPARPKLIIKNGQRVNTDCTYFVEKNKICIKTNEKCIFFSDIDYEKKYEQLIEDLKQAKR